VEPIPRGAEVEYPSEVNRPYKVVPVPDYSRWGKCGSVEKVTLKGRMEAESDPGSRMPPPTQTHPHHHSRGCIQLEGGNVPLDKAVGGRDAEAGAQRKHQQPRPRPQGHPKLDACVAGALAYIHHVNITLRDIKPDKILVDPNSLTVYFSDFGFGQYNEDGQFDKSSASVIGRESYMSSPEEDRGGGNPRDAGIISTSAPRP
jgi:hypothetical protein